MAKHRRIFDHNGVIERKPLPKMRPQHEAQEEEELPAGQAYHMDGTLTRGNILALQHTIGNTAVQRVLARGSLPAASGVIQRNFSIYAIKDLLGKDTFERIRADVLRVLKANVPGVGRDELIFRTRCAAGLLNWVVLAPVGAELRNKSERQIERRLVPVLAGVFRGTSIGS